MKKHFTKFVLITLTIAFFGQFSIAQTVIWGGPGDKNSEFDGGLNDWVVNSVSPNDSAVWIWNAEGKADRGSFFQYAGDPAIFSPSVSNGAAVFDSDYYDNGGNYYDDEQLGDGPAPAPQNSELISPSFSCEEYNEVWVQFYQFYRNYSSSPKIVVSVDGGETWGASIEVNSDIPQKGTANGIKLIDISAFAANESNVKIKFVWEGDYYFWIIDDVSITTAPATDPQITGTWFPPAYYNVPFPLVAKDSMHFVMSMQNKGGSESKNALAKVTLVNTSTSVTYFTDSVSFDLAPGDADTIEFKSFMADSVVEKDTGIYHAIYEIIDTAAATDSWKKFIQEFSISPNQFVGDIEDGKLFVNFLTTNDSRTETHVKIGEEKEQYNLNYFRTGEWTSSDYVRIVASDAILSLGINEQGDSMEFDVDISLLKLPDSIWFNYKDRVNLGNLSSEGLVVDGKPNPQLESVGYSSEHLEGIPQGENFSTPLFDGDDNEGVLMAPNSKYLIAARWGTDQTYFQGFDNTHGIYQRYSFIAQLQYRIYTGDGFSIFSNYPGGAWNMGVIFKLVVPFLDGVDDENLFPANTVVIKENPVIDNLIVDVDFQKTIEKATMVVHDINGQIIDMRNVKDLNSGTFNFNTNNLPTGTYIFTLFTKDKLISKKFVIAK